MPLSLHKVDASVILQCARYSFKIYRLLIMCIKYRKTFYTRLIIHSCTDLQHVILTSELCDTVPLISSTAYSI